MGIASYVANKARLIEMNHYVRPKYLIVGMAQSGALQSSLSMLGCTHPITGVIAGLKTICVPWFDGILLLPELEDDSK